MKIRVKIDDGLGLSTVLLHYYIVYYNSSIGLFNFVTTFKILVTSMAYGILYVTTKVLKNRTKIFGKMSNIKLFESKKIRSSWNEEEEKWYFSVIDIIEVLTESPRPRKYWNALKTKLKEEGSQLSSNMGQLKMEAADGKSYLTDVADTEQLLRLIQQIPPK